MESSGTSPASQKRLTRSPDERWIAGVCGGLAQHFGWDVAVVRVIWIASLFLGGAGGLAYLVAWIIIPDGQTGQKLQVNTTRNSNLVWGVILIAIGVIIFGHQADRFDFFPFYHFGDFGWRPFRSLRWSLDWLLPLALIALGILYWVNVRKRDGQANVQPGTATQKTSKEESMEKKLTRSVDDKMIAGVCGGLAQYFKIDPSFVRIGFVLFSLFGFGSIIVYVAMVIIVPEETSQPKATVSTTPPPTPPKPAPTPKKRTTTRPKSDPGKTTNS